MEVKMKSKRQQKLYDHYKTVFGEEPIFSLKLKKNVLPTDMKPITTLVFKPTDEMPFWKLCTIGASDYLMPEREIGWGRKANRRNEYMMLIAPDVDIRNPSDDEDAPTDWLSLNSLLWATAEYAFNEKDNITVSDTIEMGIDGKYCGTVLLLPEVFKTPSIVPALAREITVIKKTALVRAERQPAQQKQFVKFAKQRMAVREEAKKDSKIILIDLQEILK